MVENSIHENRAFAYIRTSMKAGQAAVDNQYCAIREYCEKHNVKLDSVYTVAGTPEFASEFLDLIMEEMQKNSCDTLIIASTSRLGRNPAQVRKDIDKLTNHDDIWGHMHSPSPAAVFPFLELSLRPEESF